MNLFRAFMELDENYNDRLALINDIRKAGKNYNFNKFTDAQLYRIWQRLQKPTRASKEPEHELDLDFGPEQNFDCCDCGARLTDFGQCPVCELGEEDLDEGIFDNKPSSLSSWKSATGQSVKLNQNSTPAPANTSVQNTTPTTDKYIVRIVTHGGRLRALATDGVNPAAWVAFPQDLRRFEGQRYEVDQLIWNGKNYRVAGNIVEI